MTSPSWETCIQRLVGQDMKQCCAARSSAARRRNRLPLTLQLAGTTIAVSWHFRFSLLVEENTGKIFKIENLYDFSQSRRNSCPEKSQPRKVQCMGLAMTQSESASSDLIRRAANGEESALAELFSAYRERLRRMVQIRLDRRLQGRIDPSDVLQEAFLDLASELPKFVSQDNAPVFLWLRWVTGQRLMRIHREHLGVQARDASKEISLFSGPMPMASSVSLAAQLAGRVSSASQAVIRAEVQLQIQQALNAMDDMDREIIALRNFEELTNREAAEVLGLSESAASKRYVRALVKLQSALRAIPGLKEWTD